MLLYYHYRQNNTRGYFKAPAINVYVEAETFESANRIFETLEGCYFDPAFGFDCDCCGCRWYPAGAHDSYSESEMREQINNCNTIQWLDEGFARAMIRHNNGTIETIR